MKTIALYVRVSTENKGQSLDNQLNPLLTFAQAKLELTSEWEEINIFAEYNSVSRELRCLDDDGFLEKIYKNKKTGEERSIRIYGDKASGSKSDRKAFSMMLNDSDKMLFQWLIFWSMDRFSREGWSNVCGYIKRLTRNGVALLSYTESWLNTAEDNPTTELLMTIFAWLAKVERAKISSRVKAGMARSKVEGKKLGRPEGAGDKRPRIRSGYRERWKKVDAMLNEK